MNIRGAFVHVLSDALGSVIVVLAGLGIQTWPDSKWVNYIDPVASLIMISMILAFAIPLRNRIRDKERLALLSRSHSFLCL
jgi:Co/Zn/Cd efflux system component